MCKDGVDFRPSSPCRASLRRYSSWSSSNDFILRLFDGFRVGTVRQPLVARRVVERTPLDCHVTCAFSPASNLIDNFIDQFESTKPGNYRSGFNF